LALATGGVPPAGREALGICALAAAIERARRAALTAK
jgi:hypothetical protein